MPANIEKSYGDKIIKYLTLGDEICKMWNMKKVLIVSIVNGATEELPVNLKKNLCELQLVPTHAKNSYPPNM